MKPNFLNILLLFCIVLSCSGQEKIKEWLQPYDPALRAWASKHDNYHVCRQARKYMKPELAACEDFTCIKNLLVKEEDDLSNQVLDEHKMSPENQKRLKAEFADIATYNPLYRNDYYPEPGKQFQDEEKLGKCLVSKTRLFLREYGINPDAVEMKYDEKYFKSNAFFAGGKSPGFRYPAKVIYDVEGINGVKFTDKHIHHIAHELTHVRDFTLSKFHLVNKYLAFDADIYSQYSSVSDLYRAWTRSHETQAELFPLLDFGSTIFDEFVDRQIKSCVEFSFRSNQRDKWNAAGPRAIHPGCAKLVPYIVKIQDLEKKGVQPLIRRLDSNKL